MDITKELNSLISEFDTKKELLDTKTSAFAAEIRDWCIKEQDRINSVYDELMRFVGKNWSEIRCVTNYLQRYNGVVFNISGDKGNFKCVRLDLEDEYSRGLGLGSKLPKPQSLSCCVHSNMDVSKTDIDYWVDWKRLLAIDNERLNYVVDTVKSMLAVMIARQDKRYENMMVACDEIARDTGISEVTISVRMK